MIVFKIVYWLGLVIEVVIRAPFRNTRKGAEKTEQRTSRVDQILLLQNWIAGPATMLVYIPFYIIRVPAWEKLMLDTFGEQYRDYCKKTGALLPRLSKAG